MPCRSAGRRGSGPRRAGLRARGAARPRGRRARSGRGSPLDGGRRVAVKVVSRRPRRRSRRRRARPRCRRGPPRAHVVARRGVRAAARRPGGPRHAAPARRVARRASSAPAATCRRGRSSPCWPRWPRPSGACTTWAWCTATSRRATCCSTSTAARCSATSGSGTSWARSRPGSGAPRATSRPRCCSGRTRPRPPTSTRVGALGLAVPVGHGARGRRACAPRWPTCRAPARRGPSRRRGPRRGRRADPADRPGAHELAWQLFARRRARAAAARAR